MLGLVPGDNRRYFKHCCEFTSTLYLYLSFFENLFKISDYRT